MPAFVSTGALISIGGAILHTVGLSPQRLSYSSEARVPGHPVQAGMDYQLTGLGERLTMIDAQTWPHVVGGLDALAILKMHHEMQAQVPLIRLRGNYLGLNGGPVIIQTLECDEEKLHPFDGVGRIVDVTVGLVHMPWRGTSVPGRF